MNYGADILAGLKRLETGRERRFKLHRLKLTAIPTAGISWKRHAGKKHERARARARAFDLPCRLHSSRKWFSPLYIPEVLALAVFYPSFVPVRLFSARFKLKNNSSTEDNNTELQKMLLETLGRALQRLQSGPITA